MRGQTDAGGRGDGRAGYLWIVSSCSFTMWANCWKMEPNSTMVDSMFCIVSARLWM